MILIMPMRTKGIEEAQLKMKQKNILRTQIESKDVETDDCRYTTKVFQRRTAINGPSDYFEYKEKEKEIRYETRVRAT